ncbi:MAG: hypothetical protein ABSA63_06445 [Thermoplasmata archaeon]|jgi:hypothetical protein
MTDYTSPELTAIFIQVVIVLIIVRRSYYMTRGVPYSGLRLAVLPALILILWVLSELESLLLTPWALPYLIVLDLAILIGTALGFTPVAERMTEVTREASGVGSYRIGFSLAALFVGAFVVRIGVAIVLFPSSLEFGSPPGGFPPTQQQLVLGVIDAIFSLSAGLVLARSIGIRRKWNAARAGTRTGGTS